MDCTECFWLYLSVFLSVCLCLYVCLCACINMHACSACECVCVCARARVHVCRCCMPLVGRFSLYFHEFPLKIITFNVITNDALSIDGAGILPLPLSRYTHLLKV